MTSLPEFLLARFADDEAESGEWTSEYEARTLAEVAAKRAILAEHTADWGVCAVCFHGTSGCGDPACCGSPTNDFKPWPCPTVRALAAVYKDHPDYNAEEWSLTP